MAKLYFYYVSMNAGKSPTLLQADFYYRERGMATMLWTSALDNRGAERAIESALALARMHIGSMARLTCGRASAPPMPCSRSPAC